VSAIKVSGPPTGSSRGAGGACHQAEAGTGTVGRTLRLPLGDDNGPTALHPVTAPHALVALSGTGAPWLQRGGDTGLGWSQNF